MKKHILIKNCNVSGDQEVFRTKKLNSVKKPIHPYADLAKQKNVRIHLKNGQNFTKNLFHFNS